MKIQGIRKMVQITKEAQADIAESLKRETPTEVIFDSVCIRQDNGGDWHIPDVKMCILGYTLVGKLYISVGNVKDAVATIALTMARATGDVNSWTRWAREAGYENFEIPEECL